MANKIQLVNVFTFILAFTELYYRAFIFSSNKVILAFNVFSFICLFCAHLTGSQSHYFTQSFAIEVYLVLHACASYGHLNCPS